MSPKLKFIQRAYQGQDDCWKQCGKIKKIKKVDHFHIFWAYPLIFSKWQEMAKEIMNMFRIIIDCSFVTLYLGKTPNSWLRMNISLAASKKTITQKRQPKPPTKDDRSATVNEINCVEKLTLTLRLQHDQHVK